MRFKLSVLSMLLVCWFAQPIFGQAPTSKQKLGIKRVQANLKNAGEQYKLKKFDAAKRFFERAVDEFQEISENPSPELTKVLEPEFARLSKAHQLLAAAGQELDVLKPFGSLSGAGGPVSFTKSVAPIIVSKCGNCHVNQNRGDFSAATFEALDGSTTIAYGLPDTSRIVEVIVSGEMPKGGLKVSDEELKTLKDWIKQGAKFDGTDVKASLTTYVAAPARNRERVEAVKPTGKETVSFGLHIAPILLENCGQCHINQNPRGNFSMADFRGLLRGGDGGTPIKPGDAEASQIVKRLKGDGVDVMPPSGMLDDDVIKLVSKWIDEGAAFDGGGERIQMVTVAAKAKADSQSHEELTADRNELARNTWKLVMDGVESKELVSENFVVTGSTNESRLVDVSRLCEKLVPKIAKELKAPPEELFVKGNVSVFVFDKRYDFSEFGKMVENRDFPKEIKGHWGFSTIDAYATVLMTRNQTAENVEVSLAQQIAAIRVASMGTDVPRWFADGVGLLAASRVYSRHDDLKSLDLDATSAIASMIKADDFIQNKMPADQAALVGYLFVKKLRSQSGSYNKLMSSLKTQTFDEAFQNAYGKTPAELILGVQAAAKKKRR
jgi:mono/diheme cytochrome c family protein